MGVFFIFLEMGGIIKQMMLIYDILLLLLMRIFKKLSRLLDDK